MDNPSVLAGSLGCVRHAAARLADGDDPTGGGLFLIADCLDLEATFANQGVAPPSSQTKCVACHEHGTGVAVFCQVQGTTWICQSWDHPVRRVGGSSGGSLDRRVGVVGVEGLRAWDSGRSA